MSSSYKRRENKPRTHQSVKQAKNKPSSINWLRIAAITVGLLIVLSMILSLFIVPGSNTAF